MTSTGVNGSEILDRSWKLGAPFRGLIRASPSDTRSDSSTAAMIRWEVKWVVSVCELQHTPWPHIHKECRSVPGGRPAFPTTHLTINEDIHFVAVKHLWVSGTFLMGHLRHSTDRGSIPLMRNKLVTYAHRMLVLPLSSQLVTSEQICKIKISRLAN